MKNKLITFPQTAKTEEFLRDIPSGERAEFIRACIALVQGDKQDKELAEVTIHKIKLQMKN